MIMTMVSLLRHPLNQDVALRNAQQATARLAHRRRQREEVAAYLAQLSDSAYRPVAKHRPTRKGSN